MPQMLRHLLCRCSRLRTRHLASLVLVLVGLVCACAVIPKPTQQQLESIIAGYPGAYGLQRTTRAVDSDAGIWFTFTTSDPKQQVLAYYEQQLRRIGFVAASPPYSLERYQFDASYIYRDCPMYGVEVKVDNTTKEVTAVLIISLCR